MENQWTHSGVAHYPDIMFLEPIFENPPLHSKVRLFQRVIGYSLCILIAHAAAAVANQRLCSTLDSLTSLNSLEELKENPVSIDSWATDFELAGFETCRIYASVESDPTIASTDVITCELWTDDMEMLRDLRDKTIASFECGQETVSVPGFSDEDKGLMFPESGLAVMASVRHQNLDFTLWRKDLRNDDPRTVRESHNLTISISVFFERR